MAPRWKRARPAALAALCGIILSASAFALTPSEPSPTELDTPTIPLAPGNDGGHFLFAINGKEVAILDETGLHVRGAIYYGAMLSDYGEEGVDEHAAGSRDQSHGAFVTRVSAAAARKAVPRSP